MPTLFGLSFFVTFFFRLEPVVSRIVDFYLRVPVLARDLPESQSSASTVYMRLLLMTVNMENSSSEAKPGTPTLLSSLKSRFTDFFVDWHTKKGPPTIRPIEMNNFLDTQDTTLMNIFFDTQDTTFIWTAKNTGWLEELQGPLKEFKESWNFQRAISPNLRANVFNIPHFKEDDMSKHKIGALLLEKARPKGGYLETIPENSDPWDVPEVKLEPDAFIASETLADGNIAYHLYFSNSIPPPKSRPSTSLSCMTRTQGDGTLALQNSNRKRKTKPPNLDLTRISFQ